MHRNQSSLASSPTPSAGVMSIDKRLRDEANIAADIHCKPKSHVHLKSRVAVVRLELAFASIRDCSDVNLKLDRNWCKNQSMGQEPLSRIFRLVIFFLYHAVTQADTSSIIC